MSFCATLALLQTNIGYIMKKLSFLLVVTLLSTMPLQAQTGDGAVSAAQEPAKDSNWREWTFAGVTLVVLGTSIYLIAVNNGHPVSH
jgi:hypothetical protein